jgi:ligand-binding sensor domain-containing protein
MNNSQNENRILWKISVLLIVSFIVSLSGLGNVRELLAQSSRPEGWHRLRTNSVPYQPQQVFADDQGGVWVTAVDGTEYEPGLWYRPAGDVFQYWTPAWQNNAVEEAFNPPIVKPELNISVLYAVRDKEGNTWYALKDREVLCEKADNTWITFNMPDSSDIQPGVDTTNVDSAHRIRLIEKTDGFQEVLLIAARGIVRINSDLAVAETRRVYQPYNNYFITDALIDSRGEYWIASGMGLEKGTSLINTTYVKDLYANDPSAPGSETTISRIVEDALGNVWVGSDYGYGNDGIFRFTSGKGWVKYADGVVNEIGKRVHDMVPMRDGSVWFGACYSGNGGLLHYVPNDGDGMWVRYRGGDLGLESEEIPSLTADSESGFWFVTAYTPAVTGNGTGVHHLTLNDQGQPQVTHNTYRGSSTTLTSLRFNTIAADKSGGVWFAAYDNPSIARLKADGSWQQIRQAGTPVNLGGFGFAGIAADGKNRVYFATTNTPPLAYDVTSESWLTLPQLTYSEFYYYGVYVDPQDGVWFHGAYGVYYLDSDHTNWTRYSQEEVPLIPDYRVDGVLMDDGGNVWLMTWYGLALMKKDPEGGDPTWLSFKTGDASGFTGGYRVYQDDSGQVWSSDKKKFDSQTNTWVVPDNTTAFDHRKLRFLNGRVASDMELEDSLEPIQSLDERQMTIDTRGTIYFAGGLGNVRAGIVALGALNGDLDHNSRVDLTDVLLPARVLVTLPASVSMSGDVGGDKKIGSDEMIFILQRATGLR